VMPLLVLNRDARGSDSTRDTLLVEADLMCAVQDHARATRAAMIDHMTEIETAWRRS
jgi:hypothetical protein